MHVLHSRCFSNLCNVNPFLHGTMIAAFKVGEWSCFSVQLHKEEFL
jgi:hypothetical protein